MPIVITNPEWTQTTNIITITIPLRGVHNSKVDLFYSECYVKATFEQFFCEIFLLEAINSKQSTCTKTTSSIILQLVKQEPSQWETLEKNLPKHEKQELKKRLLEEGYNKLQENDKEIANKKRELKNISVKEQMVIDSKNREAIETYKKDEMNNALKDVKFWNTGGRKQKGKECHKLNLKDEPKTTPVIPPPRNGSTINVSFTPREFSTPCRESRLEEETEWLKKQAEARRSVGFISEELRPEEHNPQYLKSKGDEFLRNRNYLAAISAFSFAIKLNKTYPDAYVGRSEAHFCLKNYNKVIQDCSTAIDLMKPEVPQNLKERAACIGRRGVCLTKLGLTKEGISELKASLCLVVDDNFQSELEQAQENEQDV